MAPGTGLRQVAISRYSLGFYPSSIIALLNVIEQLGWASVNCITGGLALNAVSDGHVSIAVGVVIIACVSLLFSFVGLRGVLLYDKYAWILSFIIFMIIYGAAAHRANLSAPPTVTGMTKSGNALSLIGVVYGSSASWSSIVSDFYVHYPVDTSKVKIFLYTTLGITIHVYRHAAGRLHQLGSEHEYRVGGRVRCGYRRDPQDHYLPQRICQVPACSLDLIRELLSVMHP
jgi:purine-cytosine permease-like protein